MSEFYKRLSQLSEYKGFNSINKFALEGLNYASSEKLNRLKKENTNPSFEIILDIANKFEDVNLNWLIIGKGEMIGGDLYTTDDVENLLKILNEPGDKYVIENKVVNAQLKIIQILENYIIELKNDKKLLIDVIQEKLLEHKE